MTLTVRLLMLLDRASISKMVPAICNTHIRYYECIVSILYKCTSRQSLNVNNNTYDGHIYRMLYKPRTRYLIYLIGVLYSIQAHIEVIWPYGHMRDGWFDGGLVAGRVERPAMVWMIYGSRKS